MDQYHGIQWIDLHRRRSAIPTAAEPDLASATHASTVDWTAHHPTNRHGHLAERLLVAATHRLLDAAMAADTCPNCELSDRITRLSVAFAARGTNLNRGHLGPLIRPLEPARPFEPATTRLRLGGGTVALVVFAVILAVIPGAMVAAEGGAAVLDSPGWLLPPVILLALAAVSVLRTWMRASSRHRAAYAQWRAA